MKVNIKITFSERSRIYSDEGDEGHVRGIIARRGQESKNQERI